jgi:hypothetical protein
VKRVRRGRELGVRSEKGGVEDSGERARSGKLKKPLSLLTPLS